MILKLLLSAVICTAVYADTLTANDEQTCRELCTSCQGTATYVDGRCECYVSNANEKGEACMMRIKRQADDIGMDFVDCEPASGDRPARCSGLLGASRRLRTHDADRIAKYFMNGGPIIGSPMVGASNCETDKVLSAPNPQTQQSKPESPSAPFVGAPKPSSECVGAPAVQPPSPSIGAYYEVPENVLGAPLGHPVVYSQDSTLGCPLSRLIPATSNLLNPMNLHKPTNLWHALNPYNPFPNFFTTFSQPAPFAYQPRHRLYHHSLLGEPKVEVAEEHIVGAPQCYTSPSQMIQQRPEILSSPGPVVQPAHTLSPQISDSQPKEVMKLFHEMLAQQNSILGSIYHYLQSNEVNLGIPYALSEPKLGAPAPKSANCVCNGQQKIQAPVLSSPQPNIQCNNQGGAEYKQRSPRMSPAVETLVEEVKSIEKIEEEIEKITEKEIEQLEKVEEIKQVETVEETSERPKREPRPYANGRKRKRDLKKIGEKESS